MRTRKILALAALVTSLSTVSEAAERSSVLSGDGTLFSVHAGAYGDLFPGATEVPAARQVLALDVQRPEGSPERVLVDGTGDEALEDDALLFFEDSSDTLFLLWQQSAGEGDSTLVLQGRKDGQWLEQVQVAGSSANLPGSSSLAVTRDSFEAIEEGQPVARQRTVLHVVWQAGGTLQEAEPFYTAIILKGGEFLGFNPVVRLTDLVPEATEGSAAESPILSIDSGIDSRAAIISFTDPRTGHIGTVESRLLPMELGNLAFEISKEVLQLGSELPPTGSLTALAGGVGSSIIEVGYRFHSSLARYLADETEILIIDLGQASSGPGVSLESIAGSVGSSIIEVGLRFFGSDGMNRIFDDEKLFTLAVTGGGLVDLGTLYEAAEAPHLIRLNVVSYRPAPEAGDGEIVIANSETGESSVVSWQGEGETIYYRQSRGEAWQETQTLNLGEGLDREDALRILRDRVRKR